MIQSFFLVAWPYLALGLLVVGTVQRYAGDRYRISALSSQLLEGRQLFWGSLPFHLGILLLLFGHLIPLLLPGFWQALLAPRPALLAVEALGLGAALVTLFGLLVLTVRRVFSARLQRVSRLGDFLVLALLLLQVGLGLLVATRHSWGARWSTGTLSPYLVGLLTLRPAPERVAGLPILVQLHLATAWLLFAVLPFTRLIHIIAFPYRYLLRPPLRVVWANLRRLRGEVLESWRAFQDRRRLLRGVAGVGAAGVLLGVGATGKLAGFLLGPRLTPEQEAEILQRKLQRLQGTAAQRALELERLRQATIPVARFAELNRDVGRYFVDYRMMPALAFLGADGLPLLLSAKCTHLGCTVGSQRDAQGRLLCPCHISYFDAATGQPLPGSPATAPLPLLGWQLIDGQGQVVASRTPGGALQGTPTPAQLAGCTVHIARRDVEEV